MYACKLATSRKTSAALCTGVCLQIPQSPAQIPTPTLLRRIKNSSSSFHRNFCCRVTASSGPPSDHPSSRLANPSSNIPVLTSSLPAPPLINSTPERGSLITPLRRTSQLQLSPSPLRPYASHDEPHHSGYYQQNQQRQQRADDCNDTSENSQGIDVATQCARAEVPAVVVGWADCCGRLAGALREREGVVSGMDGAVRVVRVVTLCEGQSGWWMSDWMEEGEEDGSGGVGGVGEGEAGLAL